MPPMILREISIPANTVNENLLAGSAFEFASAPGVVSIGIAAAATGVVANIQAGRDIIAEAFPLPILARYPIIPDEFYFSEAVQQGDRIVERCQNTTAGAIVTRSVTQLAFA